MRTASGLALIAIGAIFAFAVVGHPSFLNLQIVGWVLIGTGVAGILLPRRGYGWMSRRVVFSNGRGSWTKMANRRSWRRKPPYAVLLGGPVETKPPEPIDESEPGQPVPGQPVPGQPVPGQPVPGQPVPGQPVPGQRAPAGPEADMERETVEEFYRD
jgi:hypothetical protein